MKKTALNCFRTFATLLIFASAQSAAAAEKILFVGNSFMYGGGTESVQHFRPDTVKDLNGEGIGGVPALFKAFTRQVGLDYDVSLETSGGMNLDFHYEQKGKLIAGAWDHVILQGFSTLDSDDPGNGAKIVDYSARLAQLFHEQNPKVDVRLVATWSRADQTYRRTGYWYGKPIERMALDVRAAYDRAAANSPHIRAVIPVGEAWNRAFAERIAARNPYRPDLRGRIDLWSDDCYHASKYGYYLEALVIFGSVTGRDPRSLGSAESVASELRISPADARALQSIAFGALSAERRRAGPH